jgi:hypothetical protein
MSEQTLPRPLPIGRGRQGQKALKNVVQNADSTDDHF